MRYEKKGSDKNRRIVREIRRVEWRRVRMEYQGHTLSETISMLMVLLLSDMMNLRACMKEDDFLEVDTRICEDL